MRHFNHLVCNIEENQLDSDCGELSLGEPKLLC